MGSLLWVSFFCFLLLEPRCSRGDFVWYNHGFFTVDLAEFRRIQGDWFILLRWASQARRDYSTFCFLEEFKLSLRQGADGSQHWHHSSPWTLHTDQVASSCCRLERIWSCERSSWSKKDADFHFRFFDFKSFSARDHAQNVVGVVTIVNDVQLHTCWMKKSCRKYASSHMVISYQSDLAHIRMELWWNAWRKIKLLHDKIIANAVNGSKWINLLLHP